MSISLYCFHRINIIKCKPETKGEHDRNQGWATMKDLLFILAIGIFIVFVMPDTAYACKSDNDCSQVLKEKCAIGVFGRQCMNADTANYYRNQMEEIKGRVSKNKTRKGWSTKSDKEELALAFCWQNRAKLWSCDGKAKKTIFAHKNLDKALSLAGCKGVKKELRWTDNGDVGLIFMCKEKLNPDYVTGEFTSNRDIRQWRTTPIGW